MVADLEDGDPPDDDLEGGVRAGDTLAGGAFRRPSLSMVSELAASVPAQLMSTGRPMAAPGFPGLWGKGLPGPRAGPQQMGRGSRLGCVR